MLLILSINLVSVLNCTLWYENLMYDLTFQILIFPVFTQSIHYMFLRLEILCSVLTAFIFMCLFSLKFKQGMFCAIHQHGIVLFFLSLGRVSDKELGPQALTVFSQNWYFPSVLYMPGTVQDVLYMWSLSL